MTILNSFFGKKGSAKSGNWGHAGRPGRRGGSAPKSKTGGGMPGKLSTTMPANLDSTAKIGGQQMGLGDPLPELKGGGSHGSQMGYVKSKVSGGTTIRQRAEFSPSGASKWRAETRWKGDKRKPILKTLDSRGYKTYKSDGKTKHFYENQGGTTLAGKVKNGPSFGAELTFSNGYTTLTVDNWDISRKPAYIPQGT